MPKFFLHENTLLNYITLSLPPYYNNFHKFSALQFYKELIQYYKQTTSQIISDILVRPHHPLGTNLYCKAFQILFYKYFNIIHIRRNITNNHYIHTNKNNNFNGDISNSITCPKASTSVREFCCRS